MICPCCGEIKVNEVILLDERVPAMTNGDSIIAPRCCKCNGRLIPDEKWKSNNRKQQVVLISGLCGAGKSSVGQKLGQEPGFIHIDGDAVSKRVNWDIRNGFVAERSGYRVFDEMLELIQLLLQMGYSVIATYVFPEEVILKYKTTFSEWNVQSKSFILNADKNICIQRDKERTCWTAGEEFVIKWEEEQETLIKSGQVIVIDNSKEPLDATVKRILTMCGEIT